MEHMAMKELMSQFDPKRVSLWRAFQIVFYWALVGPWLGACLVWIGTEVGIGSEIPRPPFQDFSIRGSIVGLLLVSFQWVPNAVAPGALGGLLYTIALWHMERTGYARAPGPLVAALACGALAGVLVGRNEPNIDLFALYVLVGSLAGVLCSLLTKYRFRSPPAAGATK